MAMSTSKKEEPKTHYNVTKLLFIGLIFHVVFIGSVFDCYFTSPVVHGMKSHGEKRDAESKRLVLIVGDGLRADLLFNLNPFPDIPDSPRVIAPYLRSIVENRGAFGISHTRVPTESRPGHVAIIGGMYEDVSAVTKGWKTNPVDFDSVFNRSSVTYSFGSPDILPMFAKGATPGKVHTWSYDEAAEDFTKDATALDIWVLDHMKELFQNATLDVQLNEQLHSDKVVFFLHLLGLDTTGHSYRPHSPEYMENIRVVDSIVEATEKLINDFYGDESTSFIFTADHGMSVIGNHGDGHPDNTRTPLIAWGSGIRGPLPDGHPSSHDAYSAPWNLTHLYRRDVEQADISSLMSALLGINWPVNSVGVLPDVDPSKPGYLNPKDGDEGMARAALINSQVILEQYRMKHEIKKEHALFYSPFPALTNAFTADRSFLVDIIQQHLDKKDWYNARHASLQVIELALLGLHYLQTYDRFLIRGIVSTAYSGWAAYAALFIIRPLDRQAAPSRSNIFKGVVHTIGAVALLSFWAYFTIQKSSWTFYFYIMFPVYFWHEVFMQCAQTLLPSKSISLQTSIKWLAHAVFVIGSLQGMVLGYTHRSIWSAGFVILGLIWPLTWPRGILKTYWKTSVAWFASCIATAIFPLLSVDKTESSLTIMIGGILIIAAGSTAAFLILRDMRHTEQQAAFKKLVLAQMVPIVVTMVITASSVKQLQAKAGLPIINQVAGWITLVNASVLPFIYSNKDQTKWSRILMFFLGFGPCFIILSISVEGMFYVAYSINLIAWTHVEQIVRKSHSLPGRYTSKTSRDQGQIQGVLGYQFSGDDLRIALFFLFFVQVGFFGTGNVASISSFYLAPVYRLIPIFNPFYMTALLMFKIIVPYIMLALTFAVLNDLLCLPPFSLLLVALAITDGMTLAFFFKVQDTGSWLEIGQSITFFCIASLLLLWAAGICALGEYLMGDLIDTKNQRRVAKLD